MKAVIFGGSAAREGDKEYHDAYELGKLLAEKGYTVVNGAHDGTMEASSKGAKEKGGKTIGITCKQITALKPVNEHLSEIIEEDGLFNRMAAYYPGAELFIVLPGGTGTLSEMILTCDMIGLGLIPKKHVLVYDFWKPVMEHVAGNASILQGAKNIIFVKDINDVRKFLNALTP